MKNNWTLDLILGLALTGSILWLGMPKSQKIEHKPRRFGQRRPKYIGSIKLDQWVVETISDLDNKEDLDLYLTCMGVFYILNHRSNKRIMELKNGITSSLVNVWEISIPIKNLRDIKTATSATVCCKYNNTTGPFVDGLIRVTKRGE